MKTKGALLLIVQIISLSACKGKSAEQEGLEQGVAWAKRTLQEVNTDGMAAMSYTSLIEMGGTPVDYLAANRGPGGGFSAYQWGDRPANPWTVIIYQGEGNTFHLEGYGADLQTPLVVESVVVDPARPR
jgi:hypothetical protein